MQLHPQIEDFLEKFYAAKLPAIHEQSPEDAREQMETLVRARAAEAVAVGNVENRTIPGPASDLPVRVYQPAGDPGARPGVVYFHGGGHVIGSLDTHDSVARALCAGGDCVVVSVDYRLAPEHKFPAAFDDSFAATRWVSAHAADFSIDPSRLAVAGDSAGANIAACVALAARDQGGPELGLQVLVYPVADYACRSPSFERYAKGFGGLEAESMYWFQNHYLRSIDDAADWRASPIRADRHDGLPPAIVIAAGHDVLHDESVAYAQTLEAAGVSTELVVYPGMIHGFFSLAPMIDDAVDAQRRVCEVLVKTFR